MLTMALPVSRDQASRSCATEGAVQVRAISSPSRVARKAACSSSRRPLANVFAVGPISNADGSVGRDAEDTRADYHGTRDRARGAEASHPGAANRSTGRNRSLLPSIEGSMKTLEATR